MANKSKRYYFLGYVTLSYSSLLNIRYEEQYGKLTTW